MTALAAPLYRAAPIFFLDHDGELRTTKVDIWCISDTALTKAVKQHVACRTPVQDQDPLSTLWPLPVATVLAAY